MKARVAVLASILTAAAALSVLPSAGAADPIARASRVSACSYIRASVPYTRHGSAQRWRVYVDGTASCASAVAVLDAVMHLRARQHLGASEADSYFLEGGWRAGRRHGYADLRAAVAAPRRTRRSARTRSRSTARLPDAAARAHPRASLTPRVALRPSASAWGSRRRSCRRSSSSITPCSRSAGTTSSKTSVIDQLRIAPWLLERLPPPRAGTSRSSRRSPGRSSAARRGRGAAARRRSRCACRSAGYISRP